MKCDTNFNVLNHLYICLSFIEHTVKSHNVITFSKKEAKMEVHISEIDEENKMCVACLNGMHGEIRKQNE